MIDIHLAILFGIAILCGYGIRYMSSFSAKEYSDMCDRWRKLHDLSMASLREAMDEVVRLEKDRDEWIARFRADEQLIKEAMIPHPANPEPKYEYPLPKAYQNFCSADCPQ